jgi:hypothetical protein
MVRESRLVTRLERRRITGYDTPLASSGDRIRCDELRGRATVA